MDIMSNAIVLATDLIESTDGGDSRLVWRTPCISFADLGLRYHQKTNPA
jgi:hypothetical protein